MADGGRALDGRLGWFVVSIAGQGRADLDRQTLLRRRDEFLRAALDRLGE
jgi:hypothetical protein